MMKQRLVAIFPAILVSIMSPFGSAQVTSDEILDGSCNPDPHFSPWGTPGTFSNYYDYHGGCTMVLFKNNDWECHIATQVFGSYSGIVRAACQTPGGSIIDVDASAGTTTTTPPSPLVKINTTATVVTSTPILVDGYPLSASTNSYYYQLDLTIPDGGYIRWQLFGGSLALSASGTTTAFGGAVGMLGSFDARGSLVNRNGLPHTASTGMYKDALALEWQVGTADATLITSPGFVATSCTASFVGGQPTRCVVDGGIASRRRTQGDRPCPCDKCVTEDEIIGECQAANLTTAQQINCRFDMEATGLTNTWGATAPWNFDSPPETNVCFENTNQCTAKGGKCVFECRETAAVQCDPAACGSIFQAEREPLLPAIIRFGTYRICFAGTTYQVGIWGLAIDFIFFILLGWWTGWNSLAACVTECACRIEVNA